MAETTYQYSITSDTANGKVVGSKLRSEIQSNTTILISLNRIDTAGDDLDIVFNNALDSGEVGTLDALVTAHDGVSTVVVPIVKQQVVKDPLKSLAVHGIRFVADLNGDTTHDTQFAEDREIQNAHCYVENHTSGDYIEFTVHLPDSAETQLAKQGETVYIPPNGEIMPQAAVGTDAVPAGLIIRLTYTSVATSGPQPIFICHLRSHK